MGKLSVLVVLMLFLAGCGEEGDGPDAATILARTACTVETSAEGATIRCPDGTTAFIPNGAKGATGEGCAVAAALGGAQVTCSNGTSAFIANGQTGAQGAAGAAGVGCTITAVEGGARVTCAGGTTVVIADGTDGQDGAAGNDGKDGVDGRNGTSCTAIPELNGGTVACSDGTRFSIRNGQDAQPVVPVKLCRDDSSRFPEYGFRLGNELYGVYYDKHVGAFWAKIVPGLYMSTNGTGCRFSVDAEGNVLP